MSFDDFDLSTAPPLPTGLRGIDLLAPVIRGSELLISGEPRSGVRLLGNEIAHRFVVRRSCDVRIVVLLDPQLAEVQGVPEELREALPTTEAIYVRERIESSDIESIRRSSIESGGCVAFGFTNDERCARGFLDTIAACRAASDSSVPLTAILVGELPETLARDGLVWCSRTMASRGVFPAVDPLRSRCSSAASRSSAQRCTAERLIAATRALPTDGSAPSPSLVPALQAVMYLSQGLYVGEPYTGLPGSLAPLDRSLTDFETILDGRLATIDPSRFRFRAELPTE
ncbi:MAG TPA: hypothetical protein PLI18_04595 [Pirellulaceae bacterium]|nr:hypothetical protein [Pirellulaceae bacterium]